MELRAGSVAVHTIITPPSDATTEFSAEDVQATLTESVSSGAMDQAVLTAVTTVPGIEEISSGSITLSNVAPPQVEQVADTTTPMSTIGTSAPQMGRSQIIAIVAGIIALIAVIFTVVMITLERRKLSQPKTSSEDDLEAQVDVAEQPKASSEDDLEARFEVAEQPTIRSEDDLQMQVDVAEKSIAISV